MTESLAGLHYVAFVCIMLAKTTAIFNLSS
jgi:hypothetical protein